MQHLLGFILVKIISFIKLFLYLTGVPCDTNLVRVNTTRDRGTGYKTLSHGLEELGIRDRMNKGLNSFSILAIQFR